MINSHTYTQLIKQEAKRLGFDFCGISKAEFLEEEAPRLEAWLNTNKHGKMEYMVQNLWFHFFIIIIQHKLKT
jgi:epoxyqueuosine reductase